MILTKRQKGTEDACTKEDKEVLILDRPNPNGFYWIDKLSGSEELRSMIESGKTPEEIKASWQNDSRKFKEQRKPK